MKGHRIEQLGLDRRRFLLAAGGAAGAAFLAACDSVGPRSAKRLLDVAMEKNETLERALYRHTSIDAPPPGAKAAGEHFPSYFISKHVPVWDEAMNGVWKLEVGGLVDKPLRLS